MGALGIAPTAHAYEETCPERSGQTWLIESDGLCHYFNSNRDEVGSPVAPTVIYDNTTAPLDTAAANTPTTMDTGPTIDGPLAKVMNWIMSLFAWLLGVAAITLDNAVYYTVLTMGSYVNNLAAVGVTWTILRDIGNILLIFGFLAAGITTILNVDWYGGGKKMLPMLLVAAVFLNFSLFITEAIIDTGNLFATQFYTQINGGNPATAKNFDLVTISNEGISNKIMSQLGLVQIYESARKTDSKVLSSTSSVFMAFMSIILFLIAAFVMFSLAFILIARFVVLLFLIILAPVGFAGLAVPKLKSTASKWWDALFEQTITAPVLLLLLYIALAVITDSKFLTGFGSSATPDWSGTVNGNLTGFASVMLSFLVAMGLLLAVVIIAKKLSAFGATGATALAGKLTFGATAWGVSRTLGGAAYLTSRAARQSKTFNKVNAMTGRALSGTLDRVATGSFDVRGTGILQKLPFGGVDAGAAKKGGFTEARKQNIKTHEEEAKRIEESHKEALKNTPKDLEAIAQAQAEHAKAAKAKIDAEKEKNVAQMAKQEAEERRSADKAEVDRLAAIDKADRDSGRPSSVGDALREAQQKSATSSTNFIMATNNLAKAAGAFENANEAEKAAEKMKATAEGAAEARMKESIRASKIAYAEGIDHPLNPITFVAYGPDTAAAARKIKNSLKEKPTKDKFLDMAKKMAAELEEAGGKGGEKPKEEVPKIKPEKAPH